VSDKLQISRKFLIFFVHYRELQTNLKHQKEPFLLQQTTEIQTDNFHIHTERHLDNNLLHGAECFLSS